MSKEEMALQLTLQAMKELSKGLVKSDDTIAEKAEAISELYNGILNNLQACK